MDTWPKSTKLKICGRDGRRTYTLKEIQKYSEGFSNKIGEGTTNVVFKGILPDGMEVAIKVPKGDVAHSSDVEARSRFQLELLSRIRHQHLVNLIAYSEDSGCRMLIFQYASNGTLFENLHAFEAWVSFTCPPFLFPALQLKEKFEKNARKGLGMVRSSPNTSYEVSTISSYEVSTSIVMETWEQA